MPTHTILVAIGGSGAKCVEAAVHLAASGHTPQNVYPILIDQDRKNGNVSRCKNALQAYDDLHKNAKRPRNWFFSPTFNLFDKLLPLLPQEETKNYGAAIGLPSMSSDEQEVVRALFLPSQLNEALDSGYKKRAHMGSLLIEQMLERENQKLPNVEGLNFVIDKMKNIPQPHVVIFGSLFGGTGASGLVRIGKYFKNKMNNAIVKGVFLTPYFIIGKGSEQDKDANLVKSDADMQAVKIALEMYKTEIEDSFHHVYVIGSEISQLDGELATKKAEYGGTGQENPAHVFELIAAIVSKESPADTSDKYYTFIAETEKSKPPLIFSTSKKYPIGQFDAVLSSDSYSQGSTPTSETEKLSILLHSKRLAITRDFAGMLHNVRYHDEKSWWARQPWADTRFKAALVNWASRHISWWNEMSPQTWNDHRWGKFPLRLDTQISEYSYSAYLSRHLAAKSPADLANLFETIDLLEQHNIRSLQWAST